MVNKAEIKAITRNWIQDFIIGLQLCPFARVPFEKDLIAYYVIEDYDVEACLEAIADVLQQIDNTSPKEVETALVIFPHQLAEFDDYLDFLAAAEDVLIQLKLEGILQLASFHPAYQFADTALEDISNYTNRSPYPMIHLLREDSVHKAIISYPNVHAIPKRNIDLLNQMDEKEVRRFTK